MCIMLFRPSIILFSLLSMLSLLLAPPMAPKAWAQAAQVEYAQGLSPLDSQRPVYELNLDARLVTDGPEILRGMVWRVFANEPGAAGKLPAVATARGGPASIQLNAGTYLVHAAFGRAGASKRVIISGEDATESFILQAGGLELNAETANVAIQAKHLRFSIFEREQNEDGERKMIAFNIAKCHGFHARINFAIALAQPIGRIMEKIISARLRFQRKGKSCIAVDRYG